VKCNTRFLYSVWRNSDDKLMILDGTADECALAMGVKRQSFYVFCNRGGNGDWTITKKSIAEIEAETNG
jgi:hypothetical protein